MSFIVAVSNNITVLLWVAEPFSKWGGTSSR